MNFFQIPIMFNHKDVTYRVRISPSDGNSVSRHNFLGHSFITVSDVEMMDFSLMGIGFYGAIFVDWDTKTVTLSTDGSDEAPHQWQTTNNIYPPCSGNVVCPPEEIELFEWPYAESHPQDAPHAEFDISYMYDDLYDRMIFAYCVNVSNNLSSLANDYFKLTEHDRPHCTYDDEAYDYVTINENARQQLWYVQLYVESLYKKPVYDDVMKWATIENNISMFQDLIIRAETLYPKGLRN